MKKKTAKVLLAVAIIMLSSKASASMDAFTETKSYSGQFTDVPSSGWYQPYVAKSYRLGLLNGTDNTHFSPRSSMTNAQAVTLAARVHSIYNGKTITPVSGANWAKPYADYAQNNNIAENTVLNNMNKNVSRLSFAQLMANALPENEFNGINKISSIPDVAKGSNGADAVYLLYNAGIVTGSDKFGTFNPASTISRSEVSAIVARLLDTSLRKTFTPVPKPNIAQLLKNVSYYGDVDKCKMTPAMAKAYADAIDSLPAKEESYGETGELQAVLYDLAGDGFPLLVTTYSGNIRIPVIWACQNGTEAVDVLANEDSWSIELCQINGKPGFYTSDVPQNVGFQPAWYWFYSVQNGKVSKVNTVIEYSACETDGGKSYSGSDLPGVSSDYSIVPGDDKSSGRKTLPAAEFQRAGWSKPNAYGSIYYYTANGKKLDMSKIKFDESNSNTQLSSAFNQIGITPVTGKNNYIGYAYALVEVARWLPYQTVWSYDNSENLMSEGLRDYAKAIQ